MHGGHRVLQYILHVGMRVAENGHAHLDGPIDSTVADRLQTVREYLSSLVDAIEQDGDSEANKALSEALASIDMAASGIWSSNG